ncbi:diaminobutyrate--2-oxoglutarate transaminase [Geminicoccaceae bacterium 1502E]|nr:diaminobutyrate--2-oxoglutarate transaminase [Geminicoccaceae bacterium 1502E]
MPTGTDEPRHTPEKTASARLESNVRSYCRSLPARFARARGATLEAADGTRYIDFLAGCSTLNYGHNDPDLKAALLDYIEKDGLAHGLDFYSDAKEAFLEEFERTILEPRKLDYRLQFPGPTGANAVEAALKLARKITGRHNVIAFTNGFHGVTVGALAATGNGTHRGAAGVQLGGVTRLPYDGYLGADVDTAAILERMLADPSGGVDAPAAIIVETVQGEGGLNVASAAWLRRIEALARENGALFIIDDIQAGCGRTGSFFSFEQAGVSPDIVTLAKSLSGMGLPFAVTLMKRELDQWAPGEHNGTFRGNCHAFVTARAALEKFWRDDRLQKDVARKGEILRERLEAMAKKHPGQTFTKGRGMMRGIDVGTGETADAIVAECFANGLVIETSGGHGQIMKVLAPLTIADDELARGLDILEQAMDAVLGSLAVAAE